MQGSASVLHGIWSFVGQLHTDLVGRKVHVPAHAATFLCCSHEREDYVGPVFEGGREGYAEAVSLFELSTRA